MSRPSDGATLAPPICAIGGGRRAAWWRQSLCTFAPSTHACHCRRYDTLLALKDRFGGRVEDVPAMALTVGVGTICEAREVRMAL